MENQKECLKTDRLDVVLAALAPHCEPAEVDEENAPVRRCHRYLSNRPHQLDYAGAIRQGLPIGSGEIESSHRYIAQQRLKRRPATSFLEVPAGLEPAIKALQASALPAWRRDPGGLEGQPRYTPGARHPQAPPR